MAIFTDSPRYKLARTVARKRREKGLSAEQLAELAGVSVYAVRKLEIVTFGPVAEHVYYRVMRVLSPQGRQTPQDAGVEVRVME